MDGAGWGDRSGGGEKSPLWGFLIE